MARILAHWLQTTTTPCRPRPRTDPIRTVDRTRRPSTFEWRWWRRRWRRFRRTGCERRSRSGPSSRGDSSSRLPRTPTRGCVQLGLTHANAAGLSHVRPRPCAAAVPQPPRLRIGIVPQIAGAFQTHVRRTGGVASVVLAPALALTLAPRRSHRHVLPARLRTLAAALALAPAARPSHHHVLPPACASWLHSHSHPPRAPPSRTSSPPASIPDRARCRTRAVTFSEIRSQREKRASRVHVLCSGQLCAWSHRLLFSTFIEVYSINKVPRVVYLKFTALHCRCGLMTGTV
jgi:hypothetical protein